MKTRNSFVSNSSSCSFIIACAKDSLQQTLKKIAKKCEDKTTEWHSKSCIANNFRILDFCVSSYELLFLGDLCVSTNKKIYNIDVFENAYKCHTHAIEAFNEYKKCFVAAHSKKHKASSAYASWQLQSYEDDEKIDDDTYVHYSYDFVSDIVLSSLRKDYIFGFGYSDPTTFMYAANRADKIIAIAKSMHESHMNERQYDFLIGEPTTYQITHSTIANTKTLIALGCKMHVSNTLLHDIEKLLDDGYVVFKMKVSHDGDGYGTYNIYCENDMCNMLSIPGISVLESISE